MLPFVGLLQSCNKKENLDEQSNAAQLINLQVGSTDSFFITQAFAQAVAERLPLDYMSNVEATYLTSEVRSVVDVYALKLEETDMPTAYVINYANNEGYVIISADARYEPILAWADKGNLGETDTVPSMFAEWAAYNLENINFVKVGNYHDMVAVPGFNMQWQNLYSEMNLGTITLPSGDMFIKPGLYGDDTDGNVQNCDPIPRSIKGPLLNTEWGQGVGFNDALANMGCSNTNGKPMTGSSATAVAQLLNYWRKPDPNYDYNLTIINSGKNTETQRLLKAVGILLNTNYGCSYSSSNTRSVVKVLNQDFGYASPVYLGPLFPIPDYHYPSVISDLNENEVVFLSGSDSRYSNSRFFGVIKWYTYGTEYTWLCDGYEIRGTHCNTTKKLHMNWGWGTSLSTNWVYEDTWRDIFGYVWKYNRKMITNIHP